MLHKDFPEEIILTAHHPRPESEPQWIEPINQFFMLFIMIFSSEEHHLFKDHCLVAVRRSVVKQVYKYMLNYVVLAWTLKEEEKDLYNIIRKVLLEDRVDEDKENKFEMSQQNNERSEWVLEKALGFGPME